MKRIIYIAYVVAILIGALGLMTIWHYAVTAVAIQLSIVMIFILSTILSEYVEKRKSLTCPNCESYHTADLIQTTEYLDEIAKRELADKILVYRYKCRVCDHAWYIHKNQKKRD